MKNLKILFYFTSLRYLFIIVFFLTIDIPIAYGEGGTFSGYKELFIQNMFSFISLTFFFASYLTSECIKYSFRGAVNTPCNILQIEDKTAENLVFLTTYMFPLAWLNFDNWRYRIVYLVLIIGIGVFFVKMKFYLANPTLFLMGFRLYEVKVRLNNEERTVSIITESTLEENMYIVWIELDKNVWYVKEHKNG